MISLSHGPFSLQHKAEDDDSEGEEAPTKDEGELKASDGATEDKDKGEVILTEEQKKELRKQREKKRRQQEQEEEEIRNLLREEKLELLTDEQKVLQFLFNHLTIFRCCLGLRDGLTVL